MSEPGQLVCVGLGMTLGSHLTPLARASILASDLVYAGVSDALFELWLGELHHDVRSLQPHYREGRSRLDSYRDMVVEIVQPVRAGRHVCAAFYGHPGVFAWVAHEAIREVRALGLAARMEPGISAADCLYADLGIDPGRHGCQHYEASQFLFYRRRIDPSAYLILWQVGVAGDRSLARFSTGPAYREVLVDRLVEDYPRQHRVLLYQAATSPLQAPSIIELELDQLPAAEVNLHATLVIPPAFEMQQDQANCARLAALDRRAVVSP